MDALIIEDEPDLREALADGLEAALPDYRFAAVDSVEQALSLVDRETPAVVISDVRLPGQSGLDFLLNYSKSHPTTQFILMSAFAFPNSQLENVPSLVRFFKKPFDLDMLVRLVDQLIGERKQGFTGQVQGLTPIELLQIMNMSRRTGSIHLKRGAKVGQVLVQEGELVHAELGDKSGIEALVELIEWEGGDYTLDGDASISEATINTPFHFALMEAARLADERRRDTAAGQDHDPDPFETSISNVQRRSAMATINDICKDLVEDTPDAVASNVVDLSSGMMLGGHFKSDFTTDHFEAVSAAATNLYRGKDTMRVEDLVKSQRGDSSSNHYVREVHLATEGLHHFIAKIEGKEAILCLVTRKPGNVGMGWSALKAKLNSVEPLIPS